jgi:hypothetical protein
MAAVKAGKKLDWSLGADSPKALTPRQPKRLRPSRKASNLRGTAKSADLSSPATAINIEAFPIEFPSAASITANVVPVDVGVAA